jgi:phage-related tail protein
MSDIPSAERIGKLEQAVAALARQVSELRGFLSQQADLNRQLADAMVKSASSSAALKETQQRLASRQELLYMLLGAKAFSGTDELQALLRAISNNPETPKSLADAARELGESMARSTPDREGPRWIPEIVGGTDLETPS